ncbi:MAG: hypothetical protein U9O94_02725 [Nanoarchaeota archaeon]|nr:hypothetical protein [Nanoarchaeota archaeon]
MSLTSDLKKFLFTVFATIVASIILFMLLSLSEIGSIDTRVNALEKSSDGNTLKLDQIHKKVDDIHWYLIEKNDKIK